MTSSSLSVPAPPSLRIRGTEYPVLLPKVRDPRLHLAAVIVSLQVLGQAAFGFQLSIAQILVSLITCAVIEFAITFHRQRVIMWPASALLTGNGIAFVLRVPGTEHGDWWSLRGWWIYAATATVAILSKHLIRVRGRHIFNPSNLGLVLCFLILGSTRADPLALWWGPMSPWMALALGIILVGAFAILTRLRLLVIAATFWFVFAAGIAVIAAGGHEMYARWHLGPITGFEFWRVLVFSPEVLIFLFFMITDPKTTPAGRRGRQLYAVAVALLAVVLIAPQTTEFWTKVALLGALTLVCAGRPVVEALAPRLDALPSPRRAYSAAGATAGVALFAGAVVLAGIPAHPSSATAGTDVAATTGLPPVTVLPSKGVAARIDPALAHRIAADVVADFRTEATALRRRDKALASTAAGSDRLQGLWQQIDDAGAKPIIVPERRVRKLQVHLETPVGQGQPLVVATVSGTETLLTVAGSPPTVSFRGNSTPFERTIELQPAGNRYVIVGSRGGTPEATASDTARLAASGLGGLKLANVAPAVGIDFTQQGVRTPGTADPTGMMGGGVCWIDVDNSGWLSLFAVNSYSDADLAYWRAHGGAPRSALFRNVHGQFTDVSRTSGAGVRVRGNGCAAGDLNGDGFADLYVTAAGNDALLWNNGRGGFTEGARAAGITDWAWHSGVAIGDVNGDGRSDVFVAGYTNVNAPIAGSEAGFPNNDAGVRDLLYLNLGNDRHGHARFREVGRQLGIDAGAPKHGLGAVFTDVNGDGRLDLYVANDANPNQLYLNLPARGNDPRHLGFRLVERAARAGIADPNAGMGIAAADASGDGRTDLLVTNSHKQLHAVFRSEPPVAGSPRFADARSDIASAFDTSLAGWGASWIDLDNDTHLDLAVANGSIPVTDLRTSAEPVQVFENLTGHGHPDRFASAGAATGLASAPRVIGRGLAAADFDNDGRVDIAVSSVGGKLMLLHSTGTTGNWLTVRLPTASPGALVTAVLPDGRRLVQELHAGSSYLSSEDPRAHFGLGGARTVRELIVRTAAGLETRLTGVAANQILTVGRRP